MEADVKQQMGARPPVQRPHGSPSASVAFRFRPREKRARKANDLQRTDFQH